MVQSAGELKLFLSASIASIDGLLYRGTNNESAEAGSSAAAHASCGRRRRRSALEAAAGAGDVDLVGDDGAAHVADGETPWELCACVCECVNARQAVSLQGKVSC